ncbi:MAG: bifunctional diguanylate cyclase/phosphodiesterase [Desulfobacterales bacterium]|nr:bifunctional diguanylate cyclase/phosphodiesterase [Desulfobacterales bacterium]
MDSLTKTLRSNVKILKARASRSAIYGVAIAVAALVAATLLSCYFHYGEISLGNILKVQKTNVTLWFLNLMPFVFAFWGQYTTHVMAFEASTLVMDQTEDLANLTVALEYKVAHEATHDAVTDLPNRILLRDRLEQSLQAAIRHKTMIGLLIIDIDNFKDINDTLGHFSGDRLLKQVVSRLKGMVRKSDTIARVGPDEFAILLNMVEGADGIILVIEKVQKLFLKPFPLETLKLEVQVSIGATIFPEHGSDVDTILQRTDLALYAAKKDSKKYTIYSPDLDNRSPHRLTLMGELRQAIEKNELLLHFQPQIDLNTNEISGVEALVRWQHPKHGFMLPDEFIPMAERTGLIKPLSVWVLNEALCAAEKWHSQNLKLSIAVNISPTTFLDAELPNMIIGMLSLYEVPAEYIIFEITEGTMIKDPALALEIMKRLTDMGIRISIDDFGTGYSSLAYLKKLPATEVKIDRSFVMDMLNSENDAVIVRSIIDLGHNLSLNVVAEGVENQETVNRIKKQGCDVFQGYHLSKPINNEEFLTWLARQKEEQKRDQE